MKMCFFFRKTACPNCRNRGDRWLPALYAVCSLFQLHCEGTIFISLSKVKSTNVYFVPANDAIHTHKSHLGILYRPTFISWRLDLTVSTTITCLRQPFTLFLTQVVFLKFNNLHYGDLLCP